MIKCGRSEAIITIGINATCLTSRSSGATQRFRGLYNKLFERMSDVNFIVYQPKDCNLEEWFPERKNVTFVKTALTSEERIASTFLGLHYWHSQIREHNIKVFDSLCLPVLQSNGIRKLATIHDIRNIQRNSNYILKMLMQFLISLSIRNCYEIITVSQFMQSELRHIFPGAKIEVVYNGVNLDDFVLAPNAVDLIRGRLNLPPRFLLSVGHFEERKNYLTLIDALGLLKALDDGISLVLVGNDSGALKSIRARARLVGVADRLSILTGLSDDEVRAIYKAATALVFPSVYEGFGIPVLEGMASGIPCVLSDIPVFREITESKCAYFDPTSAESMATTIFQVISRQSEIDRLVEYGKNKIKEFTFEVLSKKLEDIYREAALDLSDELR